MPEHEHAPLAVVTVVTVDGAATEHTYLMLPDESGWLPYATPEFVPAVLGALRGEQPYLFLENPYVAYRTQHIVRVGISEKGPSGLIERIKGL